MQAENLVVDESGEGEVVKEVGEVFPHIRVSILSKAFVIKAVNLSNLARLVIAPKDGDTLGIADLKCDKKRDCFDRVISSINIVTCVNLLAGRLCFFATRLPYP